MDGGVPALVWGDCGVRDFTFGTNPGRGVSSATHVSLKGLA